MTTPAATRLTSNKTVLVDVSSAVDDARKEAIQLEATVAMIAREGRAFQQVLTNRNAPESSADLRLEARIVRLKRITPASRAAAGLMAGRAEVTADVVLIDAAGGVVVARFTAEGRSELAGTVEQAIRRASEQVVAFLVRSASPAAPSVARPS